MCRLTTWASGVQRGASGAPAQGDTVRSCLGGVLGSGRGPLALASRLGNWLLRVVIHCPAFLKQVGSLRPCGLPAGPGALSGSNAAVWAPVWAPGPSGDSL